MRRNGCWRRCLRVPWTAERSNQSILEEINPEYSLEGLMLKLTLQYFGHLMRRADSLEKTLMLGKMEGRRRRGQQRTKWLDGIINSMEISLSTLWKIMKDREAWHTAGPWSCKESDSTAAAITAVGGVEAAQRWESGKVIFPRYSVSLYSGERGKWGGTGRVGPDQEKGQPGLLS